MVITAKTRGFICTTAHPAGCRENVLEQIRYIESRPPLSGVKNALVIGASAGYGLATLIAAAFGAKANTLAVSFDNPARNGRTATAGWYNLAAFKQEADKRGLLAEILIGDAFSAEVKEAAINRIRERMGPVDLVIYSVASPVRTDPATGIRYTSAIKPAGKPYESLSVDLAQRKLTHVQIPCATEAEIEGTRKVMGGEDWLLWMRALDGAGLLADGFKTLAYSYIGPSMTHPIYKDGTIGLAKQDLLAAAREITSAFAGSARVSVNKAVVTQASAAIPVVPLYIAMLFKVMKRLGLHEGCIEQMYRMFGKLEEGGNEQPGVIRMDDWEMREDVQKEIARGWEQMDDASLETMLDLDGYHRDFLRLFGFARDDVDYAADVDEAVQIPGVMRV